MVHIVKFIVIVLVKELGKSVSSKEYQRIHRMVLNMVSFTVLFLSIILCLANTGIVNVLVSTLYSKPDEVTGYECFHC